MRHAALGILAAAAALLGHPALASDCRTLDSLAWLLGEWSADGAQSAFRESWSVAGAKTFEGRGVEIPKADPARASSEALRLVEMGDGIFYVAKVGHNDLPVAFRLVECHGGRFVFVNERHDFPRRLEYVQVAGQDSGGRLQVRVSDGAERGFLLDFARVAAPPQDPDVLAAESARFAAMIRGDGEALRAALADDLVYVHTTGEVEGRDQLVASIVERRKRYLEIEALDRQAVRDGPGSAFVTGQARMRVAAADRELEFEARYLAVYAWQDGGWRLRAWQSLRLP